jgi:hypothetical protein
VGNIFQATPQKWRAPTSGGYNRICLAESSSAIAV